MIPSNNKVPKGFKILSEFPVLVIEHNERKSLHPLKFFLTLIVMFLTLFTFVVILWLSKEPLSTLQNRIGQPDFWHFQNGEQLYFDENRFSIAGLIAITFALFFPLIIIYNLMWSLFGISRFVASPEKLIIRHQLFIKSQNFSIPKDSLLGFKHYKIVIKRRSKGWNLTATTHQDEFSSSCSEIPLISRKSFEYSQWLGIVLADFYQVKLQ